MIIDFWLNGQQFDLYSNTNLRHTLQVNDIAEVKDRQASFTNKFTTPKTANNVRIVRGLGIASDTSRIPYEKPSCQVKYDGFDLIVKGWANIKETNNEYEIYIYSGIIEFFKSIENISLGQLEIGEIDHVKNLSSVVASFSNPNYKYLITDYNGLTHYGANNEIINIDHLVPSVHVKYLWEKIHSTYGFTYSGDIFNTGEFTNLYLTYPKFIAIDNMDLMIDGHGSRFVDWFTSGGNESLYYRGLYMPEFDIYRSFTAPETAHYKISFEVTNSVNIVGTTIKYFMSVNEEDKNFIDRVNTTVIFEVPATSGTFNKSFIAQLNAGDEISFFDYLRMNGGLFWNSEWHIKIEKIKPGVTSFSEELKGMLITEFVKEVVNNFALTIFPDEFSKNLEYLTFSERLTKGKKVDWTNKYIQRKSENYAYNGYAKKNLFTYKYDNKDELFHNGSININNLNLSDNKTAFASKLYSPEKNLTEFFCGSAGNKFLRVFKFYNREVKDKNGVTTIEYKGLDKRFYFARVTDLYATVQIGSKSLIEQTTVNYIPLANFDQLDWQSLLRKNYAQLGKILNNSRIHEIDLDLNVVDLLTVDFRDTFYFSQEQQYYILNQLKFDNNNQIGEFIRVSNEKSETDIDPPIGEVVIKISWMDGLINNLSGTVSDIQMKIKELSYPANNALISFDWEKFDGANWVSLGSGANPFTSSVELGINKFRLSSAAQNSDIFHSNELQYEKIIYGCREYRATSYGNSGDDLTANFMDCNGELQTLTTYVPGGTMNFYLELVFCAVAGSVGINRGTLEDIGPCSGYECYKYHIAGTFRYVGDTVTFSYLSCEGIHQEITITSQFEGEMFDEMICAIKDSVNSSAGYVEIGPCN